MSWLLAWYPSPRPEWICVPDPITKADLRGHGECINFQKCFLITFFWPVAALALPRNRHRRALAHRGRGRRSRRRVLQLCMVAAGGFALPWVTHTRIIAWRAVFLLSADIPARAASWKISRLIVRVLAWGAMSVLDDFYWGSSAKIWWAFASQAWCFSVEHNRRLIDLELPNSLRAARSVFGKFYYDWLSRSSFLDCVFQPIKWTQWASAILSGNYRWSHVSGSKWRYYLRACWLDPWASRSRRRPVYRRTTCKIKWEFCAFSHWGFAGDLALQALESWTDTNYGSLATLAAIPKWGSSHRRPSAIDLGQEAGAAIGLMDGCHWPLSTGVRSSVARRDLTTEGSRRLRRVAYAPYMCALGRCRTSGRYPWQDWLRVGGSHMLTSRAC